MDKDHERYLTIVTRMNNAIKLIKFMNGNYPKVKLMVPIQVYEIIGMECILDEKVPVIIVTMININDADDVLMRIYSYHDRETRYELDRICMAILSCPISNENFEVTFSITRKT